MSGTIVVDRIESDASYASSINIASPLVVANTVTFNRPVTVANTVSFSQPVTVSNTFVVPAGTVSAPAITPTGDTNTGIYFPSADNIAITTGGTVRFNVDGSGRVTMPYQPAFWVRTVTTTQEGTDYIIGNTIVTNIGNHFSSSTKRFTAPISGTYMLSVRGSSESNDLHWAVIRKNGSQITDYALHYRNFDTGSITVVTTLSAGDYVTGTLRYGGATIYGADFCGYLIG